jgi:hypothetical protein
MQNKYDPNVIYEFADRLYRQAGSVMITYSLLGAIIGLGGGAALGGAMNAVLPLMVVGLVIFGALGLMLGRERAFALRLQAQTALCQTQIELNGRH